MIDLLSRQLALHSNFQADDFNAIRHLCRRKPRLVRARQPLGFQGEASECTPFILRGWVCASKHIDDGRWQTISLFLQGDLCDYGVPGLHHTDYALRVVTDAIVLMIENDEIDAIAFNYPRVARALRRSSFIRSEIAHERVVSLGQRKAIERCAHFICELFWRLEVVGAVTDSSFEFPLTQEEIGSILGMTTVHTNRVLNDLRSAHLIKQERRRLTVIDISGLERLAHFSPRFLHLPPKVRHQYRARVLPDDKKDLSSEFKSTA